MFVNYLKVVLRNLRRHKVYSFINITGLTIGIACTLLISLYILHEIRFEKCHAQHDRIYRVAGKISFNVNEDRLAALLPPMGPLLEAEFAEVEKAVRILPGNDVVENVILEYDDQRFKEENFFIADPGLFSVFTFPLLRGNPDEVLAAPFTVVISEDMARKYFSPEDPVGKTLTLNDQYELTVTGVLRNVPANTQLRCDFIASFATLEAIPELNYNIWGRLGTPYTYILVNEPFDAEAFDAKLPDFLKRHVPGPLSEKITLFVQPLKDIYLRSDLKMELEPSGSIQYVYLFSALAIAILLIACINFMNLATARSVHRSVEVGMRKTLGARREQLIRQFLGESISIAVIATILAFTLFEVLRHTIGFFRENNISIDYRADLWILPALLAMAVFVGIIAGSYPAFFLSGIRPIATLKGSWKVSSKSLLRKALVVFQFVISVTLIISTLVIYRQLHYVKNLDLGFDKESTIVIPINEAPLQGKYEGLKNALDRTPGVLAVSGTFSYPGGSSMIKMGLRAEGMPEDDPVVMQVVGADYDLIDALGIPLVTGRNFSREYASDAREAVILNQAAVRRLGWDEPIGKSINLPSMRVRGEPTQAKVIGVINDFHMQSLREKIEPIIIHINPTMLSNLVVRLEPGRYSETLAGIESIWKEIAPGNAFAFRFIDDKFDEYYRREQKLGQIITTFSMLAIFIACLGLYGLAAFTTEQRTKEIGVRKVLGASVRGIVFLFSKEFLKWVIIANLLAWPVAWYAMQRWLQNFAYHTQLAVSVFLVSGLVSLAIALITIAYQAIRSAIANPVKALRYE